MTTRERLLYQQIHPLKILVDVSAAILALLFLWNRAWLPALLIMAILPNVATFVVVIMFNLEPLKQSALGEYIKQYVTGAVEMARSAGLAVMIVGAWFQMPWVIGIGMLIIIGAWLNGVFFPE